MIDNSTDITRTTFLKHIEKIDMKLMEEQLGYCQDSRNGLTMAADRAVSYHRSKLHGKRVYFLNHSAIEYVFIKP